MTEEEHRISWRQIIKEKPEGYELIVDVPGFKKDEVKVALKDGYLTVSAAKGLDEDDEDKKGHYIRRERYAGACERSFYVAKKWLRKTLKVNTNMVSWNDLFRRTEDENIFDWHRNNITIDDNDNIWL